MSALFPTYRRFNYALRPAKHIQRKMIMDVLQRLDRVRSLRKYRYIGLGSVFFVDFSLVHRSLGIRNMICIEHHEEDRPRFVFNRPFASVDLRFGEAGTILDELPWRTPSIVWLDYDYKLDASVLSDIATVARRAPHGSVLIVTVDAEPEEIGDDESPVHDGDMVPIRVAALETRIERSLPFVRSNADLADWGLARVSRVLVEAIVREVLAGRLFGDAGPQRMEYRQLFNFHYADGARMATIGGVIFGSDRADEVDRCGFTDFTYLTNDADSYLIEPPVLTLREIRHLDSQLPIGSPVRLRARGLSDEDLARYADLYRYFPRFVDAEI